MKFTAKRLIGAGVIGVAAIVAPITFTAGLPALSGGPGSVAFAAGACTSAIPGDDAVCYIQSPTPSETYQYAPAVGASSAQTANVSGNCATATPGALFLNVCGFVYASGTYAGASKAAILGTNGTATGVGAVSPAWTIDNKTTGNKSQAEAIDFSAGPGLTNRPMLDAQIQIQRKDTGVAQNPSVGVQLVEFDSLGNVIATQNCSIVGNTGTQITADTNGAGGNCTSAPGPAAPSPFQTVEVRDTTVSTSISVVNTSTFTLGNQVCAPNFVNPNSGPIQGAKLTVTSGCKTFASFTSTGNNFGQGQGLDFEGGTGNIALTLNIPWAPETPACQPDAPAPSPPAPPGPLPLPTCATHIVQINGQNFTDQLYCAKADPITLPSGTLCTIDKTYTFVNTPTGAMVTSAAQLGALTPPNNTLAVTNANLLSATGEISVPTFIGQQPAGSATITYTGNDGSTLTGLTVLTGNPLSTIQAQAAVAQVETQVTEDWIGNVDCCRFH
jgi:hypothetical protein